MKHTIASLLFIVIFSSCSKQTSLQKEFICETQSFTNTETVNDFKNKFSVTIPKHWKTQLYFDNLQSQIFTADTTKNFTNTYQINFEYNSGDLKVNEEFKTKIITDLKTNNLQLLKSKQDNFKEKPSFWTVSKGKKSNYDFYYFEMFVKSSKINYIKVTSEIYGNKNIDERFCESIAIIEQMELLE